MSDMVDDQSSDGTLTLYCSIKCVIASKIQNTQTPGRAQLVQIAHLVFFLLKSQFGSFGAKRCDDCSLSSKVFHWGATTAARRRYQPATWPWLTPPSEASVPFPVPWRSRWPILNVQKTHFCCLPFRKCIYLSTTFKNCDAFWKVAYIHWICNSFSSFSWLLLQENHNNSLRPKATGPAGPPASNTTALNDSDNW